MNQKSLIRKIYSKQAFQKLENKALLLGEQKHFNISQFLWFRLFVCSVIFFLCGLGFPYGFFFAPFVVLIVYYGLEYWFLDFPKKVRTQHLEQEAIFFFEVLLLSLESGRNLSSALYITSQNVSSDLSFEVQKCFQEVHLGKSFDDSMVSMQKKIPSSYINEIFLNLMESSKFGNRVSESLEQQIAFLREKRILDIKGEISKLPTKISAISVLFFIPLMLLLVLAPIFLRLING